MYTYNQNDFQITVISRVSSGHVRQRVNPRETGDAFLFNRTRNHDTIADTMSTRFMAFRCTTRPYYLKYALTNYVA